MLFQKEIYFLFQNYKKQCIFENERNFDTFIAEPSAGYLEGTWKEESNVTFTGLPSLELVNDVKCDAKSYCTFSNVKVRRLLSQDKWISVPMEKKTGSFHYTVNGLSVTKTDVGEICTGQYDGTRQIVWFPCKHLPNGATWTKQGMIKSMIELQ